MGGKSVYTHVATCVKEMQEMGDVKGGLSKREEEKARVANRMCMRAPTQG